MIWGKTPPFLETACGSDFCDFFDFATGEVVEIGFSRRPWYCGFIALADLPGRWTYHPPWESKREVDGETGDLWP